LAKVLMSRVWALAAPERAQLVPGLAMVAGGLFRQAWGLEKALQQVLGWQMGLQQVQGPRKAV
jgi:hypothetical protein